MLCVGMKFCPNCGTKLVLTRREQDTDLRFRCPQCGYAEGDPLISQRPKITAPDTSETAVVILDEGQELRTTPTERAECPKCHNNLAFVWQVQTRGGDEGATQFFRCTKCNYTWRLYT
jgi:DNA-directed RNA polymerase subunit M